MKIRSTENSHDFQERLFKRLSAYQLQGLLQDEKGSFTAAVEAVQFEEGETVFNPFSKEELLARYILAEKIRVPFYIIIYHRELFTIYRVMKSSDDDLYIKKEKALNADEFAQWWSFFKGKSQSKKLQNGAEERIQETIFDLILRQNNLEWGGNIDGFIVSLEKHEIKGIIDNISVSNGDLTSELSNPARYFKSANSKHGPRYEGWYAAVRLANELDVPHILFTVDKSNVDEEHVGCAVIRELSPDGLLFVDNKSPNKNVIQRMETIVTKVSELLVDSKSPMLIEKDG